MDALVDALETKIAEYRQDPIRFSRGGWDE
jgi:hypothetical protein